MKFQTKLLLFFISVIILPTVIIYSASLKIFHNDAIDQIRTSSSFNIEQAANGLQFYFDEVRSLSLYPLMESSLASYLKSDFDEEDFYRIQTDASRVLSIMPFGISDGIRSITIKKINAASPSINAGLVIDITSDDINRAESESGKLSWYAGNKGNSEFVFMIRRLKMLSESQPNGYIKIALSSHVLTNQLNSSKYDYTDMYLVDDNGQIVLSTSKTDLYQDISHIDIMATESILHNNTFYNNKQIIDTPFTLVSVTSLDNVMSVTGTISRLLTLIVLLTLFFCLFLAGAYTRIITRPLRELGSSMESLSQENFDVQVSIRGKDEIAKLGERFNKMARQLYTLYRENYAGQIKLKQAQIENLQTQLNPHFLYNTLDTIYWMSELNRNKDASYMISNLSKMLRLTLRNSSDDISLLQEELEAISYYININRIRKGDKISFILNCPDDLLRCFTMKFVIQPLLENSLQHGLKNSKEGRVIVNVSNEEGALTIDVLNDGKLINTEEIDELISQPSDSMRGFSIRNINERLILKYGSDYKLQYFCEDGFTVFRVRQPLLFVESEE